MEHHEESPQYVGSAMKPDIFNGFVPKKETKHGATYATEVSSDEGAFEITKKNEDTFTIPETSSKMEWLVDSGALSHMTPTKGHFIQYQKLAVPKRVVMAESLKQLE